MRTILLFAVAAMSFEIGLFAQPASQAAFQQSEWLNTSGQQSGFEMVVPVRQVIGKPFSATAVTHTTQTLANGSHIDRTTTELLVQDEQGRYRRETTGPGRRIVVTDPVALVSYMIDEKSKTVRKVAMLPPGAQASVSGSPDGSPLEIARSTARRTPNTVVEDLGTRYINGVSAQGARTITTIPVESIGNDQELRVITERWYSNDIQAVVKSISSDPRSAVTTYELTNIVCAPPDVALFRIPAGYSITGSGNNSDSLRVTSPVTKAGTKK